MIEKHVLEDLIAKGYSQRQIATELVTGQTSVRYWLAKHGLRDRLKSTTNACKMTV
ncbi:MAG: hypothetical protein AAFR56_09555 [Chloroflexota bacterium]